MASKKSKYNVGSDFEKRTFNGVTFDSIMEMKYYRDVLCPAVESGDVVKYEMQKPYVLQPGFERNDKKVKDITYIADFYIMRKDGSEQIIDIKGCPDPVAKIKRKMFWYKYPELDYRWITYSVKYGGGWVDYDESRRLRLADKRKEWKRLKGEVDGDIWEK